MASEKTRIEPVDGATSPLSATKAEHKAEHLVGRKIGAFQVRRKIGQGGMGLVFEAFDASLERKVALKILPPQMAGDADWVARFMREARTAAGLDHPGIARVFAADQTDDGICYIAMQYVNGNDLAAWLRRGQRLPIEVALKVTREIAVALGAAHDAGVVHRDVKPDNVRIEPSGRVVVMDFGLAYLARGGARMTDAGTFLGTPEYCSPEQCEAGATDERSDLYSLGVCLYEMISGRVPHRAPTPYQLFKKIIEDLPVPVREIDAAVPRAVAKVIDTLLAKRPEDRYATAADLIADLDRLFRAEAVDLAAFHAELDTEEQVLTSARTVEFGGTPSQNATWVEERPVPLVASTTRRNNTRRSFAPSALRSRSRAVTALALVSTCLGLGLAAMASLPDARILAPLEAKAKALAFLPPLKADRVAILEFRQKGGTSDPELAWLKMCLPEMLSISLAPRLPKHEFVSAASALEALAAAEGKEVVAARTLGAGLYVSGTYVINGANAMFYASLNKVEASSERVIDGVSCQGDRGDFLAVIDELAARLLARFEGDTVAFKGRETGERLALHQVLQGTAKELRSMHEVEDRHEERIEDAALRDADRNQVGDSEETRRRPHRYGTMTAWEMLHRAAQELQGGGRDRQRRQEPGADKAPAITGGAKSDLNDDQTTHPNGESMRKAGSPVDGDRGPADDAASNPTTVGGRVGARSDDGKKLETAHTPTHPGGLTAPGAPNAPGPADPSATPKTTPTKDTPAKAPPSASEASEVEKELGEGTNQVAVIQRGQLRGSERDSSAMSTVVEKCFRARVLLRAQNPDTAHIAEARRLVDAACEIAPEFPLCVELRDRIATLESAPTTTPSSVAK